MTGNQREIPMPEYIGQAEAARYITAAIGVIVLPRTLSRDLFSGWIPPGICPLVAGRRLVPAAALPQLCDLYRRPRRPTGRPRKVNLAGSK